MTEPQGQIPESRLRQIAAAGKLWCGTPEAPSMAEELLSLREERDRAQEVLREVKARIDDNRRIVTPGLIGRMNRALAPASPSQPEGETK